MNNTALQLSQSVVNVLHKLTDIIANILGGLTLIVGAFVAVNWPNYLFRHSVVWPDWIHYFCIALSFGYLGFMCWGFSHPKYFNQFKNDSLLGKVLPLIVAFSFFFLASGCFGTLTSELAEHGNAVLIPAQEIVPLPKTSRIEDVTDFYLWHALNLVPSLDITETLKMKRKFDYQDNGTAWLLLAFKFIIVWIAIYHISRWNEWRKDKQRELDSPDADGRDQANSGA